MNLSGIGLEAQKNRDILSIGTSEDQVLIIDCIDSTNPLRFSWVGANVVNSDTIEFRDATSYNRWRINTDFENSVVKSTGVKIPVLNQSHFLEIGGSAIAETDPLALKKAGLVGGKVLVADANTAATGNLVESTVTTTQLQGFDARITAENTKNTNQDTQITNLTAQITNLYEINAESLAIGNGTTPAISMANDANWKANKIYQFSTENTTANLTLANGDVVGTTLNPIEKGAILKIVKIATGFGYTVTDSRDKELNVVQFGFGLGSSVIGQDIDTLEVFNADAPKRVISGTLVITGTFPASVTTLKIQVLGSATDIVTVAVPANQGAGTLPVTIVAANQDITTNTVLVLNTSQFVASAIAVIGLTFKAL